MTSVWPLVDLGQQDPVGVGGIDLGSYPAKQLVGRRQVLTSGPLGLVQVRNRVETEPVDAEPEPETDDSEHRIDDLGVVVVQVGLVMEEAMPVVLLTFLVKGPVGRLDVEEDHPHLAEAVVVVGPHVPVGLRVVARRPRLGEPRVLVAGVVHDEVRDDPDPPAMRVVHDRDEVVDAAELGRDRQEVADVVAAVVQRRRVERQEPDAVDAEPLQVVELLPQALEISDPVRVRVVEAPRQQLVEDGALVPPRIVPAVSSSPRPSAPFSRTR